MNNSEYILNIHKIASKVRVNHDDFQWKHAEIITCYEMYVSPQVHKNTSKKEKRTIQTTSKFKLHTIQRGCNPRHPSKTIVNKKLYQKRKIKTFTILLAQE